MAWDESVPYPRSARHAGAYRSPAVKIIEPALGVASAATSTVGIAVFYGTWPMFNTLAALAVNVGVVAAAFSGWPLESAIG